MMLKKMMIAICLTAVYTTHCAHAAVDFKNKAADDPAPVTCSTQNYLLPATGYTSNSLSGGLIIRLLSPTGQSAIYCNYTAIAGGSQNAICTSTSKTCNLVLQNKQESCKSSIPQFSQSSDNSNGQFSFDAAYANNGNYRVDMVQWVPIFDKNYTPDVQVLAKLDKLQGGVVDRIIVTLDFNKTSVSIINKSRPNNIHCPLSSIAQDPNYMITYGDTLTYSMTNPTTKEQINCTAAYKKNSSGHIGMVWDGGTSNECYSGFTKPIQPPNPQLNKNKYKMIDLTNMITFAKNKKYRLNSLMFQDMQLVTHQLEVAKTNAVIGQVQLYFNLNNIFLIPYYHIASNTYWTAPTWTGFDNVLQKKALPMNIKTMYTLNAHATETTECIYASPDYAPSNTCPAITTKDLAKTGTFTIPFTIKLTSGNQFLQAIQPTGNPDVLAIINPFSNVGYQDQPPAVNMQFQPTGHQSGVRILHPWLFDSQCYSKDKTAISGYNQWVECNK